MWKHFLKEILYLRHYQLVQEGIVDPQVMEAEEDYGFDLSATSSEVTEGRDELDTRQRLEQYLHDISVAKTIRKTKPTLPTLQFEVPLGGKSTGKELVLLINQTRK